MINRVWEFLLAVVSQRRSVRRVTQPSPMPACRRQAEEILVRFLTPTGNKRLNELIGFLCLMLGLLIAAALFTYNPNDASFNVAARTSEIQPARNLVGPAGAYTADLLFQGLGYGAFLLPMALLALGWK
jgi:hypothetical protein